MQPVMDPTSQAWLAQDDSAPLTATCIVAFAIETTFLILLYVSRYLAGTQKAGLSMVVLMTSAYVTCVSKITIALLSIHIGGVGRHSVALAPEITMTSRKLNIALQILCPFTTSLTKLGILCLLYRIFGTTSARYRLAIRLTSALVLVTLLVQVIIPFANCKPFSKNWNIFGPGECAFDSLKLWRFISVPNLVTTIVMVALPLPAMYKLHISPALKMGLALVCSVCVMGVIAAIMRFVYFQQLEDFNDFTYDKVRSLCWTVAESGIYFVAGVMMTLRPLVRKVFGHVQFDRVLSRTFGVSGRSGSWKHKSWRVGVAKDEKQPQDDEDIVVMCSDMAPQGMSSTAVEGEKSEKNSEDRHDQSSRV